MDGFRKLRESSMHSEIDEHYETSTTLCGGGLTINKRRTLRLTAAFS